MKPWEELKVAFLQSKQLTLTLVRIVSNLIYIWTLYCSYVCDAQAALYVLQFNQ